MLRSFQDDKRNRKKWWDSKIFNVFDIHFYNFGGAYKKGSTRIAVNYGRQRGGLVCAGGVCRIVPPSTGLGITLTKSF